MKLNEAFPGRKVKVISASVHSMIYYGEHRTQFECPCKWRDIVGEILHTTGNYIYVKAGERFSAFHYLDLQLLEGASKNGI